MTRQYKSEAEDWRLPEGMVRVLPAVLSREQLEKVCSDLFAKAEDCLLEAKEMRDYLEECARDGDEDPEEERTGRAVIAKFRATALNHLQHIRDLRAYWESKNPGALG